MATYIFSIYSLGSFVSVSGLILLACVSGIYCQKLDMGFQPRPGPNLTLASSLRLPTSTLRYLLLSYGFALVCLSAGSKGKQSEDIEELQKDSGSHLKAQL